jgi:glycine cleavage system H protein
MSTIYYAKSHEWIRVDGDTGTVGISDFAQKQLGDVVFVELPEAGRELIVGKEAAVVESVKAASEVYAPVSGKVVTANEEVANDPSLVNEDPTGEGWFFTVKLSDPAELKDLMDQAAYDKFIADQN